MLDLIYTDAGHVEQGVLDGYVLTMTYGNVGNSFEAVFGTQSAPPLCGGCLIYCEGTEYGGIVREGETRTEDGTTRFKGSTWHGVLDEHVIRPPAGQTHLKLDCDANDALRAIVGSIGLEDVFSVPTVPSGIHVNADIRYRKAYAAIVAMLARAGARLAISWQRDHAILSAVPATTWNTMNSSNADFVIRKAFRPKNHLVCLGKGEMLARAVVDVYADEHGGVSRTQSLFGLDEVEDTYVATIDDAGELYEKGAEKLAEMQETDEVDMQSELVDDYAIGDLVTVANLEAGQTASASVTSKTVTIADGVASFSCDVGPISDLTDIGSEME